MSNTERAKENTTSDAPKKDSRVLVTKWRSRWRKSKGENRLWAYIAGAILTRLMFTLSSNTPYPEGASVIETIHRWLILAAVPLLFLTLGSYLWFRLGKSEKIENWQRWSNEISGFSTLGVLTAAEAISLGLVIRALMGESSTWGCPPYEAGKMLTAALLLWVTNILTFAFWYWRLDAGGPNKRHNNKIDNQGVHTNGDFLFPQMTLDKEQGKAVGMKGWSPSFLDYLFVAFTQSTSFAPADTGILSAWAKVFVMIQATISLATVVVVAARAINMLT